MKAMLTCVAMVLFSAKAVGGTLYAFEGLSEQRQAVPASIAASLRKLAAEPLKDCQGQLKFSSEQMQNYFTSKPVKLPGSNAAALLVLPTQYCYAFFGAHAVAFWLFVMEPAGPRLVLANSQDALEVKESGSNGLPDISTYYGTSEIKYQYNGQQYVRRPE